MKVTPLVLRIFAMAILLVGAPVAQASAAGTLIRALPGHPGAIVQVTWNASATAADKAAFEAAVAGRGPVASPTITDPGPIYPVLRCSYGNYVFSDASGNMVMRNNCPYHNINWA